MAAPYSAAGHHLVSLGNRVLNGDRHVREGFLELSMELFEACYTLYRRSTLISETMSDDIGSKHFVDSLRAAFVPDFLIPAPGQCFVFFTHAVPPVRRGAILLLYQLYVSEARHSK